MKASPAAVYRTKPAALIVEPHAVYHFRWLLDLWAAGVIDHDTLSQFVSDEIQRGSIRTPCWGIRAGRADRQTQR